MTPIVFRISLVALLWLASFAAAQSKVPSLDNTYQLIAEYSSILYNDTATIEATKVPINLFVNQPQAGSSSSSSSSSLQFVSVSTDDNGRTMNYYYRNGTAFGALQRSDGTITCGALPSPASEATFWKQIAAVIEKSQGLTSDKDAKYQGLTGFSVTTALTNLQFYTGQGLDSYSLTFTFKQSWDPTDFQVMQNSPSLELVVLRADSANGLTHAVQLTVGWLGGKVVDGSNYQLPNSCFGASTSAPATTTTAPTPNARHPLPDLPSQFTAVIRTALMESSSVFTMTHAFDAQERTAVTQARGQAPDVVGRASNWTWIVRGGEQSAYFVDSAVVPLGQPSIIQNNVRQYFWPDRAPCTRAVFGFDILAGSVSSLLLATQSSATYMGRSSVRGVEGEMWQFLNSSLMVQWYFANASTTSTTTTTTRTLLRMVVRGFGASPLFVFHPFFLQGRTVPVSVSGDACMRLFPGGQCDASGSDQDVFAHVHDFLEFAPVFHPPSADLPPSCKNPAAVVGFALQSGSGSGSDTGEQVAFFFIVLIYTVVAILIGMCIQWCRMAPRLRELEDELVEIYRLQQEVLGRGAVDEDMEMQPRTANAGTA